MSLKIAILTTQTLHHTYFVKEIIKYHSDVMVFCETENFKTYPFETHHSFEDERDEYEIKKWFAGKKIILDDIVDIQKFSTLNNSEALSALKKNNADILIVFGTRPLKSSIIEINPDHIFNLHGGDPEKYRGLDSHLWAIYHNDFSSLVTTLHRLSLKLDTGDIVHQNILPITEAIPLYALRSINTEMCLKLTLNIIKTNALNEEIVSRPQRQLGRYYSAMPRDLKSICIQKFQNFAKFKNNEY